MRFLQRIVRRIRMTLARILAQIRYRQEESIYYVGNHEGLPTPLNREEEEALLARLEAGDESVRAVFIERNLRLVVYIARKFENTGIGIEDLVSIGTIGLIKAVNTFDPCKKIKLATYASRCIENEILMYLRKNNKIRSEVSLDEPLNIDWDGNELLLSDVLGTENDLIARTVEEAADKKFLREAMRSLTPREQLIMQMRFGLAGGEERTQKDVAEYIGISQSYISRLEKRIIKRLRREFLRAE